MGQFKSSSFWLKGVTAFVILVLLIMAFCLYKGKPHYFSSKEVLLGNFYRGKLIPVIHDNEKAKNYLEQAVKKYNSAEAECDLGEIYAVEGKFREEINSYISAAMYGSERCEAYFAKLSFPDYEEQTFNLLKHLADDRKFASAEFMTGVRLIEGRGTNKNVQSGVDYLEKAISKKHHGASVYMAGLYIRGEIVPQNIDKANELMSF